MKALVESRGVGRLADVWDDAFEGLIHANELAKVSHFLDRLEVDAADEVWSSMGAVNERRTSDYQKRRSRALDTLKTAINNHWNVGKRAAAERLMRRATLALKEWVPDAVASENAKREAAARKAARRREESERAGLAERRRQLVRKYWGLGGGSLTLNTPDLTDEDVALASLWFRDSNDRSRNLSARAAERAAHEFYVRRGHVVEDVAILQLRDQQESRWRFADLAVDGELVDVKNSREVSGSPLVYTDHCVRFKKHVGIPITVMGTFSFANEQDVRLGIEQKVRVLGVTSAQRIKLIKDVFSSKRFELSFAGDFYPSWIFEIPDAWYRHRERSRSEIARLFDVDDVNHAFIKLPNDIDDESRALVRHALDQCGCTLPVLFLLSLTLKLVHGDLAYQKFLDACRGHDLGVFKLLPDPLSTLDALNKILGEFSSADLAPYLRFRLRAKQILRGFDGQSWSTLYAYCGGHVHDGGRCGMFPLTIKTHRTCERCGYLICSKCGYCSSQCDELHQPRETLWSRSRT